MFQAKTMRIQDFQFATDLANTMDWNMTVEDFALMKTLEPNGCFVLYQDIAPVGIATCVGYKTMGWFGNLIVEEKYRKQGAGGFLVRHAIDYLHRQGVENVGLYAYAHLVDFYGDIGFKSDEDFVVLKADNVKVSHSERLNIIDEQSITSIARYDSECFGGDRERLLRHLLVSKGHFGGFISDSNRLSGFAIAKVYADMIEVGPLVCTEGRDDIALRLLNSILQKFHGRTFYLCLPKKELRIISHLVDLGFEKEFSVTRMFLAKHAPKNCIYIAESLERG